MMKSKVLTCLWKSYSSDKVFLKGTVEHFYDNEGYHGMFEYRQMPP